MKKTLHKIMGILSLALMTHTHTLVSAQTNPFTFDASVVPVSYQLNALDPKALADFYQETLGFTLISADEAIGYYELGTSENDTLLEIFQATSERSQTTGLYHAAFVFESREQLGALLRKLYATATEMQGFSNHITHEAIYLLDTEQNGLEMYFDRPQTEWLNEDGIVTMGNEPFPTVELFKSADAEYNGMTQQTKLGHMHLNVTDIASTNDFYTNILPLHITNEESIDATFLATGSYHHHLGANIWSGEYLPAPVDGQQGLKMIKWLAKDQATYDLIKQNLDNQAYDYYEEDGAIFVRDNSGLLLSIAVAQ